MLLFRLVFVVVFCFTAIFAEDEILSIDDVSVFESDFFSTINIDDWKASSVNQRQIIVDDFLSKKLFVFDAKSLGLENGVGFQVKKRNRGEFLLLSEFYENTVVKPLVTDVLLEKTKKNLIVDKHVYQILIGYKGCKMKGDFSLSKEDAKQLSKAVYKQLLGGGDFKSLVLKYSSDPLSKHKEGDMGWVSWGRWVPAFQDKVYSLGINSYGSPLLTDFGFHILIVTEEKPSEHLKLSSEDFSKLSFKYARNIVAPLFKAKKTEVDMGLIEAFGFKVNNVAVDKIELSLLKKNGPVSQTNVSAFLSGLENIGSVFVIKEKGFGVLWLVEQLKKIPASYRPQLSSRVDVENLIHNLALQHIASTTGFELGLEKTISYSNKLSEFADDLLYKSYYKKLKTEKPVVSENKTKDYYNNNIDKFSKEGVLLPFEDVKSKIKQSLSTTSLEDYKKTVLQNLKLKYNVVINTSLFTLKKENK